MDDASHPMSNQSSPPSPPPANVSNWRVCSFVRLYWGLRRWCVLPCSAFEEDTPAQGFELPGTNGTFVFFELQVLKTSLREWGVTVEINPLVSRQFGVVLLQLVEPTQRQGWTIGSVQDGRKLFAKAFVTSGTFSSGNR